MFGFGDNSKDSTGEVSDLLLAKLRRGSSQEICGRYLYALDKMSYLAILQSLEDERIKRKASDVIDFATRQNGDWNNALLITLLRSLGDLNNKFNYISLGTLLDSRVLERERDSLLSLETLLIYCSGLLERLPHDDPFIARVRSNGEFLSKKYNLQQLPYTVWSSVSTTVKHPIIRLSQVAHIYYRHDMLFNRVINCRTRDDVMSLFNGVEASEYWLPYVSKKSSSRIGVMKSDLITINFVVTMLYSYGLHFGSDEMVITALEMLENLPPESNGYINKWRNSGIVPQNAFDTQALIQLTEEYCKHKRCGECPIAKHMVSSESIIDRLPDIFL